MKTIRARFFILLITALVCCSLVFNKLNKNYLFTLLTLPTQEELNSPANIEDSLPVSLKASVFKSRASSVRVVCANLIAGTYSLSSGVYAEYEGNYYVITADHGIMDGPTILFASVDSVQYDAMRIVYSSKENDYAIFQIEQIPYRVPISIEKDIPSAKTWKKRLQILDKVIYTGYPNGTGPLTISGEIMGFSGGRIFVRSYGWSGASGSGVFSKEGDLIGIVSALELGSYEDSMLPIEDSVIITPTYLVDWAEAFGETYE